MKPCSAVRRGRFHRGLFCAGEAAPPLVFFCVSMPVLASISFQLMGCTGAKRSVLKFRRGRSGKNDLSALFKSADRYGTLQETGRAKQLAFRRIRKLSRSKVNLVRPCLQRPRINRPVFIILRQWHKRRLHDIAIQLHMHIPAIELHFVRSLDKVTIRVCCPADAYGDFFFAITPHALVFFHGGHCSDSFTIFSIFCCRVCAFLESSARYDSLPRSMTLSIACSINPLAIL